MRDAMIKSIIISDWRNVTASFATTLQVQMFSSYERNKIRYLIEKYMLYKPKVDR